ncbi:MAG: M81 family metallopeptidase [Enhydrobacter sp.]
MARPIRIAVLFFAHETVTFLANDTTLADFTYPGSPASGEALLAHDPKGYMGGFVKVAREHDGVELVGIESPLWPKTGTGSGWITQEAYETFLGKMIAELKAGGKWDGVYLSLHGAMGVRGVPKPEADIALRRVGGIPDVQLVIMLLAVGHLPERLRVAQSPRRPLDDVLKIL